MRVVGIATISVDGRITPPGEEGTPFSSPETRQNFVSEIRSAGATVSGRRTYDGVKQMMIAMLSQANTDAVSVVLTRDPQKHRDPSLPKQIEFTDRSPRELIQDLDRRGMKRVLIAGGGEIYAAFAAESLIDEWIVVIEPILLGGGRPLFAFETEQQLRLVASSRLNDSTMLLRYEVLR